MPNRTRLNLAATMSYLLLNMALGVVLTPVLIRYLGVESFGYVSLSSSLVSYLGLLTLSIQGSMGRFVSIALTGGELEQAREYYSSGFWGLAGVVALLALLLAAAVALFQSRGGAGGREAELLLFLLALVLAFVVTTAAGVLLLSAFVRNRLELKSLCEAAGLLARGGVTLFLVVLVSPTLSSVGWGFLAGSLVLLLTSAALRSRLTPELVPSLAYLRLDKLKELVSLSWWMMVNQIGALLFLQVEVVVAGFLLGARAAGIYAALLVFVTLLRSLARAVASTLVPLFLAHAAKNERAAMVSLARRAEVAMGLAVALPVGLIVPFSGPLLKHWLGEEFVPWSSLLVIMVLHLVLNLTVLPLFNINVACNMIKKPALVTLALGIFNVALMLVLGNERALGLYGIALSSALTLSLKNVFYTPWYASRVLGTSCRTLYTGLLPGVAAAALIAGAGFLLSYAVNQQYLQSFVLTVSAISLGYLAVTFRFLSSQLKEAE